MALVGGRGSRAPLTWSAWRGARTPSAGRVRLSTLKPLLWPFDSAWSVLTRPPPVMDYTGAAKPSKAVNRANLALSAAAAAARSVASSSAEAPAQPLVQASRTTVVDPLPSRTSEPTDFNLAQHGKPFKLVHTCIPCYSDAKRWSS